MVGRLRFSIRFSGSRKSTRGESMRLRNFVFVGTFALCLALASVCSAQNAPADQKPATQSAAPTPLAPLSQPAITGPLSGLPPAKFDAAQRGQIPAKGIFSV